jgi:hypothetical protein
MLSAALPIPIPRATYPEWFLTVASLATVAAWVVIAMVFIAVFVGKDGE